MPRRACSTKLSLALSPNCRRFPKRIWSRIATRSFAAWANASRPRLPPASVVPHKFVVIVFRGSELHLRHKCLQDQGVSAPEVRNTIGGYFQDGTRKPSSDLMNFSLVRARLSYPEARRHRAETSRLPLSSRSAFSEGSAFFLVRVAHARHCAEPRYEEPASRWNGTG